MSVARLQSRSGRRRLACLLGLCLILGAAASAWAFWSAGSSSTSSGGAAAASVNQGATPTATAAPGRTVSVSWGSSTLTNGNAVSGYVIKRYSSGTGVVQTTLSGCAGTISGTSCTESGVPAGQWKY